MTVADLAERMTAAEEAHWIALYKLDPWGEQRDDMRSALISQLIHNSNSRKPKKLEDFMLFAKKRETVGDTPSQIRKNFESLIAAQRKK